MARGRPSKKQHIIDTAGQLFSHLGYQATSIDVVTQTAGVSKPTVYNNFPSKLSLLHEWLILQSDHLLSMVVFDSAKKIQTDSLQTCSSSANKQALNVILNGYELLIQETFYLSILRICIGESQKLNSDVLALFFELDNSLNNQAVEVCLSIVEEPLVARAIVSIVKQQAVDRALGVPNSLSTEDVLSLSLRF
ncbi:TetR/AcrR family transcriptional regulator [Neptunomonas phycophila]|uniref:TetR/AcrR family transcriptional regulator n=1 Tax=Neptunomonas phycophila TaxID=1572645 RepID=UPI000948C771|nr:TetR/AcrR family transcriptional regulator [Neptunomonas phycophila]